MWTKAPIVILRQLSANEKVRQEVYYHEKRLHDETTALGSARREGRVERDLELITRWRKMGYSEEQIKSLIGDDYNG